jgi:hypothetical protein
MRMAACGALRREMPPSRCRFLGGCLGELLPQACELCSKVLLCQLRNSFSIPC